MQHEQLLRSWTRKLQLRPARVASVRRCCWPALLRSPVVERVVDERGCWRRRLRGLRGLHRLQHALERLQSSRCHRRRVSPAGPASKPGAALKPRVSPFASAPAGSPARPWRHARSGRRIAEQTLPAPVGPSGRPRQLLRAAGAGAQPQHCCTAAAGQAARWRAALRRCCCCRPSLVCAVAAAWWPAAAAGVRSVCADTHCCELLLCWQRACWDLVTVGDSVRQCCCHAAHVTLSRTTAADLQHEDNVHTSPTHALQSRLSSARSARRPTRARCTLPGSSGTHATKHTAALDERCAVPPTPPPTTSNNT